jgi:hypothetical protein
MIPTMTFGVWIFGLIGLAEYVTENARKPLIFVWTFACVMFVAAMIC